MLVHVDVVNPKDPIAPLLQKCRPLIVGSNFVGLAMRSTVDLNDDILLAANEVREVRADWNLAYELEAAQLPIAQMTPEEMFGRDRFGTENARAIRAPWLSCSDHASRPWLPLTPTLSPCLKRHGERECQAYLM